MRMIMSMIVMVVGDLRNNLQMFDDMKHLGKGEQRERHQPECVETS